MKKLMFVAAAALCATVPCKAIESANVVGYDSATLRTGMKAAGAAFVPVSGAGFDLQSLKVSGYNAADGYADGEIYLQTLTPGGATIKSFTWIDLAADPDDPDSVPYYGWYDDDTGELGELTIAPGDGLAAFGPNATFGLQSAGQVPTSDVAVTLRTGMKFIANPTPATVSLNSGDKSDWAGMYVAGYNAEDGYADGEIYLQTLTPGGATIKSFTWIDLAADPDDPDSVPYYGWYDDDTGELGELSIAPGDGLAAFGPSTAFSVVFPGVTL